MKRFTLYALLALFVTAFAGSASAQMVDLPHKDRVQVRAYGLWWLSYVERLSIDTMSERADKAFEKESLHSAERQYGKLARYGDKFSQFRLGLIAIKEDRSSEAWAWFKLSGEGGVHDDFNEHADLIWDGFSDSQRALAESNLDRLSMEYSDLALARRMERIFRKQARNSTGSRLGNTGSLNVTDGLNLSTDDLYANMAVGLEFSQELIENYGSVYLGEFEVIEPEDGEEAAPVAEEEPGSESE